jgi:hypothetical protein
VLQTVFVIQIASAHPLQHVVAPNTSFVLSRLVLRLNNRPLHSSLLAFRLLGILQNVGSHSIQQADTFSGQFPTLLTFDGNKTSLLKLLQWLSYRGTTGDSRMLNMRTMT